MLLINESDGATLQLFSLKRAFRVFLITVKEPIPQHLIAVAFPKVLEVLVHLRFTRVPCQLYSLCILGFPSVKSARFGLNPMNVGTRSHRHSCATRRPHTRRRCWRTQARAALTGRACDCRNKLARCSRDQLPSVDGWASMALRSDVVEAAGVRSSEPVQSAAELGQSAVHCCGGVEKA